MTASDKVTLYYMPDSIIGFGVTVVEARLIEHGRRKYAQYDAAPYAKFIPKGKRTTYQVTQGSRPTLFIVKGWGHPPLPDAFEQISANSRRTRYLSHAKEWLFEANAHFKQHFTPEMVIADYRHDKRTSDDEQVNDLMTERTRA